MFRITTPVSHLFKDSKLGCRIIASSDVLELRDNDLDPKSKLPYIYHCNSNILAKLAEEEISLLRKINKKYSVGTISFHLSSRYQNNDIKENGLAGNAFVGTGKPYSAEELKQNIRENCKIVREIFGNEKPILLENMNHLLTDAYDVITDPEFISEVVSDNDTFLLLDLPHAKITATNKKLNFKEYLAQLPLERCKQLHLSRPTIIDGIASDKQGILQKEDWSLIRELLGQLKCLEYITIEYYKDGDELLDQLNVLKEIQMDEVIKLKEWDSSFFGFLVAVLDSFELDEKKAIGAIEKAKGGGVKCIYCLSDGSNEELLKKIGFSRVDEKVVYEREIKKDEKFDGSDVVEADSKDVAQLKKIASQAFRGISRFYKDKNFDQRKVDILYEKWIDKLMKDSNSTILVIKESGKIIAFNGVSFKGDEGHIELIAVDEGFKGKGYGKTLINHTLDFFKDNNICKVEVVTQNNNISARNLYTSTGFVHKSTNYWFHWWNDGGECNANTCY